MKLLLLGVALLVSVTVLSAREDGHDWHNQDDSEYGVSSDSLGDLGNFDDLDEEDYDNEEEDDDDDDENEGNEDEIPTTNYPKRHQWPGYKCMLKAKMCFMNASDCEEHLACYEEKSRCMQAVKKEKQMPSLERPPMMCKTVFNKCIEKAGSDCFKKFMCYRKKGFCYRSRGRGRGRRPRCHHHRRHRRRPHHHRPTMNPQMLKCKMEWKLCFMQANNCSTRLQCMFDFHDCMNRSRPTAPPSTMSPETEGDVDECRRRWNPKLMAKCKEEFRECIANASTSCPLKMRCFWRMKMCLTSHRRSHGCHNKKLLLKVTTNGHNSHKFGQGFGGQWTNKGKHGGRFRGHGKTRKWNKMGNGGMRRPFGGAGAQWRNAQTGGHFQGRAKELKTRGKELLKKFQNGFKRMQKKGWRNQFG